MKGKEDPGIDLEGEWGNSGIKDVWMGASTLGGSISTLGGEKGKQESRLSGIGSELV